MKRHTCHATSSAYFCKVNCVSAYISGLFLSALLMVLTIGLPVAYNSLKKIKETTAASKCKNDNPYSNSTEEKAPNNNTISVTEEYAHEEHHDFSFIPHQISIAFIHAHEGIYQAFHKELHYPPPNFLS